MTRPTEVRKTGELIATDERGVRYTVLVFADFHDTMTDEGRAVWMKGNESYRLTNGEPVNRLGEREFQVVSTGVILKS